MQKWRGKKQKGRRISVYMNKFEGKHPKITWGFFEKLGELLSRVLVWFIKSPWFKNSSARRTAPSEKIKSQSKVGAHLPALPDPELELEALPVLFFLLRIFLCLPSFIAMANEISEKKQPPIPPPPPIDDDSLTTTNRWRFTYRERDRVRERDFRPQHTLIALVLT